MSNLHDQIRSAQVNAAELVVVRDLHDRGLCDPQHCELCRAAFKKALEVPPMAPSLEDKLATMLWYLEEVERGRRDPDKMAIQSYLDDAEITNWLDKMKKAGRVTNTRFTERLRR